jgi:hypothetical protein
MATLVTRSGKGSPLTHAEVDANFTNLNTDKLELSGGTMTGNLSFGDNDKAIFGAGSDLQIYHDGSNSIITDQGTGNLKINASSFEVNNFNDTSNILDGNAAGAVKLYHAGSQKFTTTSTGVDITGTLTSDALTVDGSITLNNATAQNISFTNTAVNPTISSVRALNIDIDSDGNQGTTAINFTHDGGAGTIASFNETGDISFYEDTGTTPKFFWDASAESLKLSSAKNHGAGVDTLLLENVNTGQPVALAFTAAADNDGSGNEGAIYFDAGATGIASDNQLQFNADHQTSTTPDMVITGSGNVGIGTSSPQRPLHVDGAEGVARFTSTASGNNGFEVGIGASSQAFLWQSENAYMQFATNATERMRIDSSGNVGIGTSSPSQNLHIKGTTDVGVRIEANSNSNSNVNFADPSDTNVGQILYDHTANYMRFKTNDAEAMRIDSSGNLLVGRADTGVSTTSKGLELNNSGYISASRTLSAGSGSVLYANRLTSDGEIVQFRKDGVEVGSIFSNGGTYLGMGNDDVGLLFLGVANDIRPWNPSTNAARDDAIDLGDSSTRFKDLYLSGGLRGDTTFKNNAGTTEYARFDNSGNLLVGMSSYSSSSAGTTMQSGLLTSARSGNIAAYFNRLSSDGSIVSFAKDGSTVGSIGYIGQLVIHNSNMGIGFSNDDIRPVNGSGVNTDNSYDLGHSSVRWDDIYATNGTIQTSDRNEKQDIAELSDAEQRVAVAAKGLLRKFRWKDAVAERGDEARTHFGIIAQDLQAAFAAEGLDAGNYAMFIHSTWTDEETGEEKSRMGVRYSELLAFIIAAI